MVHHTTTHIRELTQRDIRMLYLNNIIICFYGLNSIISILNVYNIQTSCSFIKWTYCKERWIKKYQFTLWERLLNRFVVTSIVYWMFIVFFFHNQQTLYRIQLFLLHIILISDKKQTTLSQIKTQPLSIDYFYCLCWRWSHALSLVIVAMHGHRARDLGQIRLRVLQTTLVHLQVTEVHWETARRHLL